MTASTKGRRGPRPSKVTTGKARGPGDQSVEPQDHQLQEQQVTIEPEERRLSFNEVYRYGRATYLGLLPIVKMKRLTQVAMDDEEPLAFIDAQAAAMEYAIDAGDPIPEFPVREAAGGPSHRAVCPTRKEHADVHTWRIRPRNKKDCVCHVCGATWVQ